MADESQGETEPMGTARPLEREAGSRPRPRAGPPWAMDEMVALGPSVAAGIAADRGAAERVARLVRWAVTEDLPVSVTGCGTSEHAAMGVAALIADALDGVRPGSIIARDAFTAALDPWPGLCIGISHEGATEATVAALAAARAGGARIAVITAAPNGPVSAGADEVYPTPMVDSSWCHTVGYLSPVTAGAAIAAVLRGIDAAPDALERLIRETLALAGGPADLLARKWQDTGAARVVTVGSGTDRAAARELALKFEEGAQLPATARDTETLLHGHLSAVDAATPSVFLAVDPRRGDQRAGRAAQAARAMAVIGGPVGAIVSGATHGRWPDAWTPAGRIVLPDARGVPPLTAAVLGSAAALQVVALAVIHARGTDPDLIRRGEVAYQRAADVASEPLPSAAPR